MIVKSIKENQEYCTKSHIDQHRSIKIEPLTNKDMM